METFEAHNVLVSVEGNSAWLHDSVQSHVQQSIKRSFFRHSSPENVSVPFVEVTEPTGPSNSFTVRFITENYDPSTLGSLCTVLSSLGPIGVCPYPSGIHCFPFSVEALPSRKFFFGEMTLSFDSSNGDGTLSDRIPAIQQELAFALKHPLITQSLVATREFSKHPKMLYLRNELVRPIVHKSPAIANALLDELHHFLLATDEDFKAIRSQQHLIKLIRTHLWLKKHPNKPLDRRVTFRMFRSTLFFPFGQKRVLSLALSVSSLQPDEQFDHRHVLSALQRCIPSASIVPNSFYSYRYANDPTHSIYVEVERRNGAVLTNGDLAVLKRDLPRELAVSIEQVVSRVDLPHNEEDSIRAILLLSQQVKSSRDFPQVMIQFQGQKDAFLDFHVTIIRVRDPDRDEIPSFPQSSDSLRLILLKNSVVGTIRREHEKQALTFLARCSKAPFLRHNRSIDFLKAREFIIVNLEVALGQVRDLNGGLFFQQHQLLENIQPMLTKEERKELFLVENIFHSITPSIMKNIVKAEHVLSIFRLFIKLRDSSKHQADTCLIEKYAKGLFVGFICPESFIPEELLQAQSLFRFSEHDLAVGHVKAGSTTYGFGICLSSEPHIREGFGEWARTLVEDKRAFLSRPRSLRMAVPRLSYSLDPRLCSEEAAGSITKLLFEGLTRLDETGQPVPAIAENIATSDDGLVYTFSLRPTFWSNGASVTAYDFVYAWQKASDPNSRTAHEHLFYPIKNARAIKTGTLPPSSLGVFAISDKKLRVELEHPAPYFLELCAHWIYSPVCANIDETVPGWAHLGCDGHVSNGPFKIIAWNRKKVLHLAKNQWYWDKNHVFPERLEVHVGIDQSLAQDLYARGEIDWLGTEQSSFWLERKLVPRIHERHLPGVHVIAINVHRAPCASAKIRRALALATDRKKYQEQDRTIAHSLLPPTLSFLDRSLDLDYDPRAAVELFLEGLSDLRLARLSLPPLRVFAREGERRLILGLAKDWEEIFGVRILVDFALPGQSIAKVSGAPYDLVSMDWLAPFHHPIAAMEPLLDPRHQCNVPRWSHDAFTLFVRKSIDQGLAQGPLREAEQLLLHEMPVIPLYNL